MLGILCEWNEGNYIIIYMYMAEIHCRSQFVEATLQKSDIVENTISRNPFR